MKLTLSNVVYLNENNFYDSKFLEILVPFVSNLSELNYSEFLWKSAVQIEFYWKWAVSVNEFSCLFDLSL